MSGLEPSWVRVESPQTALETELRISYSIDNYDPNRFNDIHCLLHCGEALLYALRVPKGGGLLRLVRADVSQLASYWMG